MATNSKADTLIRQVKGGIELPITVLPRSSRNTIVGLQNNTLKIKTNKAPVDGQANAACCRLLADHFNLPAAKVTVVRGHTSRKKTVKFEGLSLEDAREILKPYNQN